MIHRLLHGFFCATPLFAFTVWLGATSPDYRHVRVIPPPVDWEKEGWA